MNINEIQNFCKDWLAAWTGNKPEKLIQFYSLDAVYVDPANKNGLKGHEQILPYFQKLLRKNPNWKWEAVEIFPIPKGFVLKWKAHFPMEEGTISEYGLDIVECADQKISRNEVYFDPSAIAKKSK